MSEHRANLAHPRLTGGGTAHGALDRRIDENSLHGAVLRRRADDREMAVRPVPVDVEQVVADHIGRRHLLALGARELPRGHGRQPYVRVQPNLM